MAFASIELSPDLLAGVMLASAAVVFPVLLFGPNAPYGRFSATGWGPLIPARIAWFTQEIWSFALPVAYLTLVASPATLASLAASPTTVALVVAFLAHYAHRDLVYPLVMRPGRPTPLAVWLASTAFCLFNGSLQTWSWVEAASRDRERRLGARVAAGLLLFAWGMAQNIRCDAALRALRRRLEKEAGGERGGEAQPRGGKPPLSPSSPPRGEPPLSPSSAPRASMHGIPRGGLFERVSAANYFAECVEWTGYALAAGTPAAWAFAAFTWANLAPRAARYHQWYQHKFPDYPKERKRLIPYLW